jgi:SAM-dependent methyltransferase
MDLSLQHAHKHASRKRSRNDRSELNSIGCIQAFHWFDLIKSLQEFHRILKPSGRLALVWSLWDQTNAVSKEYTRYIISAEKLIFSTELTTAHGGFRWLTKLLLLSWLTPGSKRVIGHER